MPDVVGLILGATLSLFILSYLVGDNHLYRVGLYLFIGTLVGYSFGIVIREVLLGMALAQLLSNPSAALVPFVLGMLLLFKGFPKHAYIGNLSIAYIVGVGTAVALGGALLGTLAPQVGATGRALGSASVRSFRFGLLDGVMVVVGTICTLLTFTFTQPGRQEIGAPWGRLLRGAAAIGRVFLIVALGLAFAGALTASLSIFIGRMQMFIDLAIQVLGR
jgi:hypothetical protein